MSTNPPPPEPYGQPPAYPASPGASTPPSYAPATGGYASAPPPAAYGEKQKGSSTLGIIALIVALAAIVIGSIINYIGGQALGSIAEFTGTAGTPTDANSLPPEATERAGSGALLIGLGWLLFAVLGLWAFVQGIVATVKDRGRPWGITAIVLSVIGAVVVFILMTVGIGAGAAPYVSA